jgi:2-oxoisovalerate dehydrogenase E1 component
MITKGEHLIRLYREMQRIRTFELQTTKLFKAAEFAGFLHTSVGQEAVAVGVCSQLRPSDFITATHRSHGHLLAKGLPINELLAEIYGKSNGVCGGVAGHVHVADMSRNIVGGNGILGQNQPIAAGLGLGLKMRGRDDIVVSFFGDGTANEGAVHEAMNLAAIWLLPVLFLCERNDYAELSHFSTQFRIPSIADRAPGYGFSGYRVDGWDVEAVESLVEKLIADMRKGGGPVLIEACVVRWHGHYEGDSQSYRQDARRSPDPLDVLAERYPEILNQAIRREIELEAQVEMDSATEFARQGEYPDPATVFNRATTF